jgi:pimeloyl-ACP methyl ester carboxylesterase
MAGDGGDSALCPVSRAGLLGHLRPVGRYAIACVVSEQRDDLQMRHYRVSGAMYRGCEVWVSLRICVGAAESTDVVLSIPGGGGSFPDDALWWLAGRFRGNYAAIDWIGRGQSPSHDSIACRYDPIFMESDDIRESFLFHNLSAIWGALNWMFDAGWRPVDIVGGSWGGVFCFLLAAIEPRIKRIFPTFGCGGFSLRGIEKRSMWDAAFEEMGTARTASWCAAFDPLLRTGQIGAAVYFETATNDKFFSIDMAMETWRRIPNPLFLGILPNRDHDMKPFGVQPYIVQRLAPRDMARCRAITHQSVAWFPERDQVACSTPECSDSVRISLLWSEQLPAHGNMSREWQEAAALGSGDNAGRFLLRRSNPAADLRYFASGVATTDDGTELHAATPIHRAEWQAEPGTLAPPAWYRTLVDACGKDPLVAPIGDKCHPAIVAAAQGWCVQFNGMPRSRATRFGIRPWLLPPGWQVIEVVLATPLSDAIEELDLVLSRRYQRLDEEAVFHPFRDTAAETAGGQRIYRFARAGFVPGIIVEQRFRAHPLPAVRAVLDDFDAIGIVDLRGRVTDAVVLVSISIL